VVDGNVERVLQRLTGIHLTKAANLATCANASREFPARRFQSGHDGTGRNRVRTARAQVPGRARSGSGAPRRGKLTRECAALAPEKEGNLVCARVARWQWQWGGKVRLVQRPKKPRSCPACGNCPNRPSLRAHRYRLRHTGVRFAIPLPSPITLFMCCGTCRCGRYCPFAGKGKWIAIDRIPQMPNYRADAKNPEGRRHHLTSCVRHFFYEVARSFVRRSERYGCIAGRNQSA
jgi:hypothetical protein